MQHNQQTTGEDSRNATAARKRQRRPSRWIWCTVGIVLLTAGIIAGTAGYSQYKASVHEEREFAVLGANNFEVADYEAFLRKYPESEHLAEVKARLAQLRTMHATWANIHDCNSLQTFRSFIKTYPYPTCEYYLVCEHKIDSLEWTEARRTGTPEALAKYCRLHPQGDYVIDAELAIDSIEKANRMKENMLIDSAIAADMTMVHRRDTIE